MPDITTALLLDWVDAYERAWRERAAEALDALFTADATYLTEPFATPMTGLDAIKAFWLDETEPGEAFSMTSDVVACSGRTGVVRVLVRYADPHDREYLDLWVATFADDGRVSQFEEWPFWPTHGRSPLRPAAQVLHASEVTAAPYGEWVRSWALSSGVYRLAAGSADGQSPHDEDEVYVVTAGVADLEVDGMRTPVRAGSVAYVPRRVPHRFVDITEDLEVAVVFAPPEETT
ncbi:MAG: cupin domain-containing protein [Actinomycetes bacterium]